MPRSRMQFRTFAPCRSNGALGKPGPGGENQVGQAAGLSLLPLPVGAGLTGVEMKTVSTWTLVVAACGVLLATAPGFLDAQTDCLSCHADASLQDASGHSVGVDAPKFH